MSTTIETATEPVQKDTQSPWLNPKRVEKVRKQAQAACKMDDESIVFESGKLVSSCRFAWFYYVNVRQSVRQMSDSTLGEICAHSSQLGFHHDYLLTTVDRSKLEKPAVPDFINATGVEHIKPEQFAGRARYGHQHLIDLAVSTLLCIRYDEFKQDALKGLWARLHGQQ